MSVDVDLNDDVKQGQKVATQFNAFGDPVYEFFAPRSGKVWTNT